MAKFCTQCGRPLQDGEVCNCQNQANQVVNAMTENPSVMTENPSVMAENPSTMEENSSTMENNASVSLEKNNTEAPAPEVNTANQVNSNFNQGMPNQVNPNFNQGMPNQVNPNFNQGMPNQGNPNFNQGMPNQGNPNFNQGMPNQGNPNFNQGMPNQGNPNFNQGMPNQGNPNFNQGYVNQGPSAAQQMMSKIIPTFINVIKQPKIAGREFVQNGEIGLAFIYIAIQALVAALVGIASLFKVESKVSGLLRSMQNDFTRMMFGEIQLPYGKLFFLALIGSFVLSMAFAGILKVMHSIVKKDTTFEQEIRLVATRSIVMLPVMLLALIMTLISFGIGYFIFSVAAIYGLLVIAEVDDLKATIANNNKTLAIFGSYVVYLIVYALVLYLASKMLVSL
ncbi:hypothetical protein SAMN04487761_10224 [Lachnospiraceae bacterium C7]|nr:hypothetical protein SAMN04487761_10224 [Lachnospiraceae bacterium C7]